MTVDVQLADVDATIELGRRIGAFLDAGDLVVLIGELGTGKTTLTQGIAEAVGVRGPITSPTFVIAREHPSIRGGPALVHVDAYRVESASEIDDLDLDIDNAVTVVEWGAGRVEHLTDSHLSIALVESGAGRLARVRTVGPRWSAVDLSSLRA